MKFMFMIYHDEAMLESMPPGEMQALIDSALDYDEEIRRSGHYVVSNALQSSRTARTIRVRGSKVSTTDGPFAETRQLAHRTNLDRAHPRRRESRGHRARLVHVPGVDDEEPS